MTIFDVVKKPVSRLLKDASPGSMVLFHMMEKSQAKRKAAHAAMQAIERAKK